MKKIRKIRLPDISAIILENFKAFGVKTVIPLKSLTVLSGMNNSGKSTIYQALLLLEQSKNALHHVKNNTVHSLVLNGNYVQLGISEDVFHKKSSKSTTIGLQFSSGKEIVSTFRKTEKVDIMQLECQTVVGDGFSYEITYRDGNYRVDADNYFNFLDVDLYRKIEKWIEKTDPCATERIGKIFSTHVELKKTISIHMLNDNLHVVRIAKENIVDLLTDEFLDKLGEDKIDELIECVGKHVGGDSIDLISGYHSLLSKDFLLHTTYFIPPFRGFPKRFYSVFEKECFAYNFDLSKMNTTSYKVENGEIIQGTFRDALNYWIEVFFGKNKELSISSVEDLVQIVSLNDNCTGKKISINNLGFGVGQILPILYKCLSAAPGGLLVIDEPETHLHPSMQSKLADFFMQMVQLGRKVIVETHSEYIIDKLIYHCIKSTSARDATELYWVMNGEKGASVLPIAYDDLGYVSNAPDGFLSEKAKLVEELTALRFAKLDSMAGASK